MEAIPEIIWLHAKQLQILKILIDKENGMEFSKICEKAIIKNLSLSYQKDLLMKKIKFHQAIVDEKTYKVHDILEIEREFDQRLWEKALMVSKEIMGNLVK